MFFFIYCKWEYWSSFKSRIGIRKISNCEGLVFTKFHSVTRLSRSLYRFHFVLWTLTSTPWLNLRFNTLMFKCENMFCLYCSVETNNLSPSSLVAIIKSLLSTKYVEEFRASNQVRIPICLSLRIRTQAPNIFFYLYAKSERQILICKCNATRTMISNNLPNTQASQPSWGIFWWDGTFPKISEILIPFHPCHPMSLVA